MSILKNVKVVTMDLDYWNAQFRSPKMKSGPSIVSIKIPFALTHGWLSRRLIPKTNIISSSK